MKIHNCAALNVDGKTVKLGVYNTPKEAFMEYKRHKEALIIVVAGIRARFQTGYMKQ